MKYHIEEKSIYCFKANLEHLHDDECFEVSFKVLAENRFEARAILEEWLKNPEQTGYKYKKCVGLIFEPSGFVLVAKEKL